MLMFSCVCQIVSCLTGQCRDAAAVVRNITQILYCCVQACMTAQVWKECRFVESATQPEYGNQPIKQQMR
jgi:hypothetical protein